MSVIDDAIDVATAFKLAAKLAPMELQKVGDTTIVDVSPITSKSGVFLIKGPGGARYRVKGLELERER